MAREIFPVSAFVAAGFEHSIANMYFIPLGLLEKARFPKGTPEAALDSLTWGGFLAHLVPVTMGNFIGGAVMVGVVYYVIYLRGGLAMPPAPRTRTDPHAPRWPAPPMGACSQMALGVPRRMV